VKTPLVVGIVVAALLLAAGVLAPLFGSAARKTALQAQEQAELARRKLARVSPELCWLKGRLDTAALRADEAALEAGVERAAEQWNQQSVEWQKWAAEAAQRARQAGLPAPTIQLPTRSKTGVIQGLTAFDEAVKYNDNLLKAALRDAQAAATLDSSALSVAHTLGTAEYLQAAGLLAEAEMLRVQQEELQARLLKAASEWKVIRSTADYFRALDVSGVLDRLAADLDELRQRRTESERELAAREGDMQAREAAVARVAEEMKAVRRELEALETAGFPAGDDQAFETYRARYAELSRRVRELEEQEQELRYGGRHGAVLVGDDPNTFAVEGGEPVSGLAELQQRLAVARQAAQRYGTAHVSLEQQMEYVRSLGQRAQEQAQRFEAQVVALEAQQKEIAEELARLAAQAFERESEALQAAEAAVRAFKQSQSAAQNWIRAARELQQNRDPNRRNERLNALLKDPYLEQVGQSAEAAARVLAARIQALRVERNEALLEHVRLFNEINPDPRFQFDTEPFRTAVDAARTSGLQTLKEARDIYEKLSKGPPNTAWVPLGALAAAQHLTARLDAAQAEVFRAQAVETLAKALEKREQNPYLRPYVEFRDYLAGPKTPSAKPEEEDLFSEDKPPADSSEEGETKRPAP